MPATITGVDQIAIAVHDLDEALDTWKRAFGVEPTSREVIESDGVEEAMIDIGGVWLQILAPTRDDSPVAKFLTKRGPGLHHIGFTTPSVAAAQDALRAADVPLIDETPRTGGGGHTIGFVHPKGLGGVLTELVQSRDKES